MELPINLSSKLLTPQNLNLIDEGSPTSPDSYPPVMIPLSSPRLPKPIRFRSKSAPDLYNGGSVGDIFFGCYDEVDEDLQISYHQRNPSRYPNTSATEDGSSERNDTKRRPLSVKAISPLAVKKQTNPWKNSKRRQKPLSLGKKPSYVNRLSSPLVPKVIPVAERVELIIQEFAPCFNDKAATSQIYEIKSRVKKFMIKGIMRRAIKKLSCTRADGKRLLWEALTSVAMDLFDRGMELRNYDDDGSDTFISNMAFIGDMAKLDIIDEMSTLSALSHLCKQHQFEGHPALIIGAEAIVVKSDIDLIATPTGRVIHEYLCCPNPNGIYFPEECLSDLPDDLYSDGTDYTPDESLFIDY